jgi:catechol 2,3-dioxygenase-like lactoylglutathione lyase family enzyme
MNITGIDRILISVRDMNESLAFFQDWMEMEVVTDTKLQSKKMQQLWNLSAETNTRAVYLKSQEHKTLLELIEFDPRSEMAIRSGTNPWDFGLYDLGFYVEDVEKIHRELINKGFKSVSQPVHYKPDWVPNEVKEMVIIGPNEINIAHFERVTPPKPVFRGKYGKMTHAALIVEDMERARSFYQNVMGLDFMGSITLTRGLVDEVLKLPPGTGVKLGFALKKDSEYSGVELLEFSLKGISLRTVARPPHLGLFAVSFKTDDLSGLIKKCKAEKIKILSGPIEMNLMPHGSVKAITIEGPGTEIIECFEKI